MTIVTTVGAMMDAIKQASDMDGPERPRTEGNVTRIPTEFETRLRMMIAFEAQQQARQAVIRQIKMEGKAKVSLMPRAEITRLANEHLRRNAAELLAQAEASGAVQNLQLAHERRAVDAQANCCAQSHGQNGEPK